MPEFSVLATNSLKAGSIESSSAARQFLLQDDLGIEEQDCVFELVEKAWHPALQLLALLWLIKKQCMNQELSDLLGFDKAVLQDIQHISPLEAFFPAVGDGQSASLKRVIIYPLPSEKLKAVCLRGASIHSFDHLASLTGMSGIIALDEPTNGNSWQMASIAAMTNKMKFCSKYAFSGIVSANGEIRMAQALQRKKAICEEKDLRLIYRVKHVSHLESWLNQDLVPLPLLNYFGSESEQMRCMDSMERCIQESKAWFSFAALEDFYGIKPQDMILGDVELLSFEPKLWQDFLCETAKKRIENLRNNLGSRGIVWFLAGQISSLQFGIGSIIGFKQGVSILQLDFSSSKYKQVITLYGKKNARELKNVSRRIDGCKKIKVSIEINDSDSMNLSMILYLGSHNPIGEAKAYSRMHLGVDNFVIIEARDMQGVMNLEEDWLEWVQEINSAFNELRGKYHWQKIHLFQTAPTALCMALGIAFGHFLPIEIYHYQFGAKDIRYKGMYAMERCIP